MSDLHLMHFWQIKRLSAKIAGGAHQSSGVHEFGIPVMESFIPANMVWDAITTKHD